MCVLEEKKEEKEANSRHFRAPFFRDKHMWTSSIIVAILLLLSIHHSLSPPPPAAPTIIDKQETH